MSGDVPLFVWLTDWVYARIIQRGVARRALADKEKAAAQASLEDAPAECSATSAPPRKEDLAGALIPHACHPPNFLTRAPQVLATTDLGNGNPASRRGYVPCSRRSYDH